MLSKRLNQLDNPSILAIVPYLMPRRYNLGDGSGKDSSESNTRFLLRRYNHEMLLLMDGHLLWGWLANATLLRIRHLLQNDLTKQNL
jgi:hypothetical protein